MNEIELRKKIAVMEFMNDQMTTELFYVDKLLIEIGFPKGIESARVVAYEMLEGKEEDYYE